MNFDSMTVDQLDRFLQDETNELDTKRQQLKKVRLLRDQKWGEEQAAKKLAEMDPATRNAVLKAAQSISAASVEPTSAVGAPGK